MKLTPAFVSALLAVGLTSFAYAQDESPSPAPSVATEEKPIVTPEMTPPTTPSPVQTTTAPSPTPAPVEKKETAPSPTPSSTATKKQSTTSEPKPSAVPRETNKKMSVEAAIKDNETRWESAVMSHDLATIQAMVASDFMGVSSKGKFINKSALLAEFRNDKDTYKSTRNEQLNVRRYGPNAAVCTGTAREKGTGRDGKAFDRTFRFTDTWVERNGSWQCVASQVMLLGKR